MRAVVYDGALRLERSAPMPELIEGDCLLKVRLAGICNTDLELMEGMYGFSGILGHEFVADVVEGPENLVGRRVVGEINVGCGQCDFCQKGIPSQCRDRHAVGIHNYPGAFADYLRLPAANLYPVADSIPDEAAVFMEPLAAALQVLESTWISPHHRVVLLGAGKLGMLTAQAIKLTGADLVVVVRREKQAELLNQWGIATAHIDELPNEQAQVVVDCTGQAGGFADALRLVESRGTILLKSTYYGLPQVDLSQVAVRELRVVGSRCGPFPAGLRLLEQGLVDVQSLIEARYSLDDVLEGFAHAGRKGALKVLLQP